jgi:hypothetical protein
MLINTEFVKRCKPKKEAYYNFTTTFFGTMGSIIKLNYFYGDEQDKLCFYRIPKVLFTKQYYSGLSTDAKLLYGLMLDQIGHP